MDKCILPRRGRGYRVISKITKKRLPLNHVSETGPFETGIKRTMAGSGAQTPGGKRT